MSLNDEFHGNLRLGISENPENAIFHMFLQRKGVGGKGFPIDFGP